MWQRIVAVIRAVCTQATRPEFWLCALLLWLLLSAGRSLGTPWAGAALTEALRWGVGIGLTLALGRLLHRTGRAARGVLLLTGALALAGVWDGLRPDRGGVVGPYQDHQLYGSALLVLLPTALALALTGRSALWRLGAQAVGAAALACLLLSQTRSAWAGLLVSAVVFAWLWRRHFRSETRRLLTTHVCLAMMLAGALIVWSVTAPGEVRVPLASRTATLSRLGADPSWQMRLTLWRGAFHLAESSPLTGCGLGRYPARQWAWTHQGSPLTPSERPTLSEEAHSLYVQTAAETGLIGLLLYAAVLTTFAIRGLRRLRGVRRPGSREALVIATLSMTAGQAVDALASPSWQFAEVSLLFWAALGIGLAALRRPEPEPSAARLSLPLRRALQFTVSGSVAVTLAAQALPFGLLPPVEAYTSQAGYIIQNPPCNIVSNNPASVPTLHSGQTIDYRLIANYKNPSNQIFQPDVTLDSTTTFVASKGVIALTGSAYRFTAPTVSSSTPVTILAYFVDSKGKSTTRLNANPTAMVTVVP